MVTAETRSSAVSERSSWALVAGMVVLLTAIISVLLIAFAWPAVRSSVHDVPIAIAGPPATASPVLAMLEKRQLGTFTITRVADTAAAEAAIRDRGVYGAIDVSSGSRR